MTGAADIAAALGGQKKSNGGFMCRCPAHDDSDPSLSVDEQGGKVLVLCFAGCSNVAVIEALKARGLWESGSTSGSSETAREDTTRADRQRAAYQIWRRTSPAGGAVRSYLASRSIDIPAPQSIREISALQYPRTDQWFPCMVAGIQAPDGSFSGIHRTFLMPGGHGKAGVASPKMALGPIGRGAVRLGDPAGGKLALTEGIEDGLAVMQLYGVPCWAVLGGQNFQKVQIPDAVTEVIIFGDSGTKGREFAEKGTRRFRREGKEVTLLFPEGFDDFNDLLQDRQNKETAA